MNSSAAMGQDVTGIASALERGELSSVTLIEYLLDRIERLDGRLGAFVDVYGENALAAAQAADIARRAGHAVGPLHGIPIAFKDIIDVKGHPTRLGTVAATAAVDASRSADVVETALAAGMVALGKTSTVEYAFGGWGLDPLGNAPWNPWDRHVHRIPGGSSSGSAVAVCAGLVPVAIGSDTSGSIRVPASYCGIVGLKTTTGPVSRRGVLPLSSTLDTVGPLVRSVRDAELMLALLTGARLRALGAIIARNLAAPAQSLAGVKIAVVGDAERAGVADAVLANFDASLKMLAEMGAKIETVGALPSFAGLTELIRPILMGESYALHHAVADDPGSVLSDVVRAKLRSGAGISAKAYLEALNRRRRLQDEYRAVLSGYDALVTPTTETVALPVGDVDESKTPARLVRLANLVDCFALSLPNGTDGSGLPTGLQIMATGSSAVSMLEIGRAYEAKVGWNLEPAFLA